MATSGLLGNLATSFPVTSSKVQTTTPAVVAQPTKTAVPGLPLKTSGAPAVPTYYSPTMGVTAKTPVANVSAPATTLPSAQTNVASTVSNSTPAGSAGNQYTKDANGNWGLTPGGTSNTASPVGTALTPAQIAAQAGGATTGAGSLDPTATPQVATGTTAAQAGAAPAGTTNVAGANGVNNSVTNATTQPVTQAGLLAQAANIASGPSKDYLNQQAQANAYNQQLQQSQASEAQALANIQGSPHTVNFAQGAENVIRNQGLMQQQGLATAYQGAAGLLGAANTQQGQEQSGLLGAANSAAPIQVSPGNYLASPLTGVSANAAAGQQQGIQSATNWAIAQQNMAQGADYQGQSQNLSNAIQTMAPVGQKLTNFISSTGQNPATSPLINQQISKINAQLYPQQVATLNAAVNDIRSYAIQILGSQSGANPTDVTSSVNSFDFTNFSAADLSNLLGDLNNLGNTRLSQLQSATNASYGANAHVGTPAEGMTATDQGALNTGGMSPSSMNSNIGKALLGTIASTVGSAANAVGANAGSAIGSAAGTGIAAKVLGLIPK